MKRTTSKTPEVTVHVLAQCKHCNWEAYDYRRAVRQASAHVKDTGHTVALERGTCFDIQPSYGMPPLPRRRPPR